MLGREELGRSRILRDLAKETETRSIARGEVRVKCGDHEEKQAKAIRSHTFKPAPDSAIGKALIALSHEPAGRMVIFRTRCRFPPRHTREQGD
jgi:hypothetical protein